MRPEIKEGLEDLMARKAASHIGFYEASKNLICFGRRIEDGSNPSSEEFIRIMQKHVALVNEFHKILEEDEKVFKLLRLEKEKPNPVAYED